MVQQPRVPVGKSSPSYISNFLFSFPSQSNLVKEWCLGRETKPAKINQFTLHSVVISQEIKAIWLKHKLSPSSPQFDTPMHAGKMKSWERIFQLHAVHGLSAHTGKCYIFCIISLSCDITSIWKKFSSVLSLFIDFSALQYNYQVLLIQFSKCFWRKKISTNPLNRIVFWYLVHTFHGPQSEISWILDSITTYPLLSSAPLKFNIYISELGSLKN